MKLVSYIDLTVQNRFLRYGLSLLAGVSALLAVARAERHPAIVSQQFIYENAPFPECHASTIEQTREGEILAAWFGGTKEKDPDVEIWLSRLENGKWTEPVSVADGIQYYDMSGQVASRFPTWNPVLFQPQEGPLMLFYKVGPNVPRWWGMLKTSEDGGRTWSEGRRLPEKIFGPIKNRPFQLPNGDILAPSSDEHGRDGWWTHFEITSDGGRTWSRTPALNDGKEIAAIQGSILDHGNGRLQAIGRTKQLKLFSIWSEDSGRSWSEMTLLDVPNPNSGTDAVTLKDGRHALVYNHSDRILPNFAGRTPLNVAISQDGIHWDPVVVLEDEPGEYSYPSMIQTADGMLHITYTWKREKVRHVVIDPQKL